MFKLMLDRGSSDAKRRALTAASPLERKGPGIHFGEQASQGPHVHLRGQLHPEKNLWRSIPAALDVHIVL